MNKIELQQFWLEAANRNALLTPPHDPTGLALPWNRYRTVLTPQLAQNLVGFIATGEFRVTHYQHAGYANTPDYYAVVPTSSQFSVTASGVPKGWLSGDAPKDTLVFVSGEQQGWHCFGENGARIHQLTQTGVLTYIRQVA